MNFPTKYDERAKIYTNPGSRKKELYHYVDNHILVKNGKVEDTQDIINSYAEECDINNLIKRFTLGDYDALNQVRGFYADVTKFPTSYSELYDKVEQCKRMFESLKPEVREEFNNNPVEFFESYGTKEFIEKVKKYNIDTNVPVNDKYTPIEDTEPVNNNGGIVNEF